MQKIIKAFIIITLLAVTAAGCANSDPAESHSGGPGSSPGASPSASPSAGTINPSLIPDESPTENITLTPTDTVAETPTKKLKYENAVYDPNTSLYWEKDIITVYKPSRGGIWYPRVYELQNGDLICGFDTNEDSQNAVIKAVKSSDGGKTWSTKAVTISKYPQYKCANVAFYQHKNGELWAAYRAIGTLNGQDYSAIMISSSTDNGESWVHHSLVAEEMGSLGVYEPIFIEIGGKIAVFYANDSLNTVSSRDHQNIEFKIWDGSKWSEKYIASNGNSTKSRDGMPAVEKLSNGKYLLVIESTALKSQYPFVLQLKFSPDGLDWSERFKTIYIPKKSGRKAAAPFAVQLPDGRVAISFQTDEDMSQAGDKYSEMKIMVSTDASCTKFSGTFKPFITPDGYNSVWNGLGLYKDQYLLAVSSTNYPQPRVVLRRAYLQ